MMCKSRNSIPFDDSSARPQLQSSAEVVQAAQDSDVICCTPLGKRQLRVLVVDDYPDVARSWSILLTMWGHQVWVACDGVAALEMASAYQPDVLLLDIAMPKLDGCQVARQLRRQRRFENTLLIATSGWADEAHRLLGEEAGFDLYLIKPIEPSTIEVLLLLERDRLARSSPTPLATARRDAMYGELATRSHEDGRPQSADRQEPADQACPLPVPTPSR